MNDDLKKEYCLFLLFNSGLMEQDGLENSKLVQVTVSGHCTWLCNLPDALDKSLGYPVFSSTVLTAWVPNTIDGDKKFSLFISFTAVLHKVATGRNS